MERPSEKIVSDGLYHCPKRRGGYGTITVNTYAVRLTSSTTP